MTENGTSSINARKLITKNEILATSILLIVCFVLLFIIEASGSKGNTAQIYRDNKLVRTVNLKSAADEVFTEGNTVIEIKGEKIGFISSNCHGKQCVKSGFLSKSPQMAVCLPNKTVIKIVSSSSDFDTTAY